tara:strand:+ start:2353 stop:2943 length:591 start_codon:yes stop_codon:yes gene_type:complete
MPYTKEQLVDVEFYTQFIDDLRVNYLKELVGAALTKFRDTSDVLLSFEDITTGLGIEKAVFEDAVYSTLNSQLNTTDIEPTGYTDFSELIRKESCSLQSDVLKESNKDADSDALLDRIISELLLSEVATSLPNGVSNGDTITSNNTADISKWLVENNQKRPFPDLQSFYAYGINYRDVKTLTQQEIDEIPEGEPVD